VLVTGGTGKVGQHAARAIEQRGLVARVLSRRQRPLEAPAARHWVQADLLRDDLSAAVEGVDAVIHLASEKSASDKDVTATRRLLAAAKSASIRHFVVISIIGCDRIPLPFYRTKVEIESAVREGSVPWSIARAAQFHSFVERLIAAAAISPIPTPFVGDLRFQAVDEREVAEFLLDIALGAPAGDAPEIAGPEVIELAEAARLWLAANRSSATLLPVQMEALFERAPSAPPWARPVLEGYRDGLNTARGARTLGRVTFAEWLKRRALG
jgi:uncharacterized protein YbjT (DUF2867 family)